MVLKLLLFAGKTMLSLRRLVGTPVESHRYEFCTVLVAGSEGVNVAMAVYFLVFKQLQVRLKAC
jgi:hypothetical protein